MAQFEKVVYTAKAHTTVAATAPRAPAMAAWTSSCRCLARRSNGTNPEELFAAGWSACFLSAIKVVALRTKVAVPADAAIDAEVDLGTSHGAYGLAARLNVSLPGMDRAAAQSLVNAAHQVCPYSIATRGNIDVALNVSV